MFGSASREPSEHSSRPWRIHELTRDFRVLDVWRLPTPGEAADFGQLVDLWSRFDPSDSSPVVRALFAVRWALGRALGLDRTDVGLGARVTSLRDRLPADLQGTASELGVAAAPFVPLYVTDDEFAMEIANRTVHGVLHVGWVPEGAGRYCGQMTVLVKPNGMFGRAYLAAIAPFRYLLVYPLMLRDVGRAWSERQWRTAQSGDSL
jgi:hypothetical protein